MKKRLIKNEKLNVVTTFYPMYKFTKNVAGNLADLELLIPSTIEAHDWELGPKDMVKIKMQIYLYTIASTWRLGYQIFKSQ